MKIYGAGLAGLIAANTSFQNATIYEAGQEGCTTHKALLRFRTAAVGEAVGIDFKSVKVHKAIALHGEFVAPSIWLANQYSKKVIGKIADRSIWNLAPTDRFIAPENFIEQLVDRVKHRIHYNYLVDGIHKDSKKEPIISTIPLSVMLKFYQDHKQYDEPEFKSAPITVSRYRIKDCDTYQTIYFPDPDVNVFRASLTGDMLIIESVDRYTIPTSSVYKTENEVHKMFGIDDEQVEKIESTSQRFGKIAPINDAWRRKFLFDLSHEFNIYSLGRFATWRNILLDDVLKDINVIKKLINGSEYDRNMHR